MLSLHCTTRCLESHNGNVPPSAKDYRGSRWSLRLKTLNVQSKNYKSTRLQQRLALESARKQKEMKGMILDSRKTLFMSLRDNTGINWYRAKQILKHLEVHQRHPNVTSQAMREKITEIANLVKQGK